jgi:hypothetical protein
MRVERLVGVVRAIDRNVAMRKLLAHAGMVQN